MSEVYPEIMHLDQLNIAKQCWSKGPLRVMSAHMRIISASFFKGMGFKLDCQLKSDGRSGTSWFKASQWNEACRGSDKVPGGLAAWMSSLLFYVGEDFLEKQESLRPRASNRGAWLIMLAPNRLSSSTSFLHSHEPSFPAGASAEEVLRARYGAKGKELFNIARMYDMYVAWHNTNYLDTPNQEDKDRAALASALAGDA